MIVVLLAVAIVVVVMLLSVMTEDVAIMSHSSWSAAFGEQWGF